MKILVPVLLVFLSLASAAQTVNVSGRIYYDVNGNHIFDGADSALPFHDVGAERQGGGFFFTTTNALGQYSFALSLGVYDISLIGLIDSENYLYPADQHRVYTNSGPDIVDFACQKRDSVEYVFASVQYIDENIPNTGAVREYKFNYGYEGSLGAMPATFRLNFSPLINVLSASPPPSVTNSGKLEWYFPSLNRVGGGYPDSINVTFNIPAVGDTIGSFIFSPKLIPGIAISPGFDRYFSESYQDVDFPEPQPVGNTRGIKWLRHSPPQQLTYEGVEAIDTTQNGDGYFIAGSKGKEGTLYGPAAFMAKLTKDGLAIWEKYVDSAGGETLFDYVSAIKHTADGGCMVLGSSTDRDTTGFSPYGMQVAIARFNGSGDLVWKKVIGGSRYEEPGSSIEVLADGSCIFGGSTDSHDGDFVHSNSDTLKDNIFVAKVSAAGSLVFANVYGGSGYDYMDRVKALANGTFLLLCSTASNDGDVVGAHQHYTMGPEPTDTSFSEEAWVINVDGNGNIIWNKCFGGSGDSFITGAAENNGGILLTGSTNSKNGDLPWYPEAAVSLWALQISNTGNILGSKLHKLFKGYQDTNYVRFPYDIYENYPYTSLHKTRDGNFVVGMVASDKYGPIKTKHGKTDAVIVKINPVGEILWQKAIGGTKTDFITDIQLDDADDIVFVGGSESDNDDLYQHSNGYQYLIMVGKMGITNLIEGKVFVDNNANQVKDPGELYYSQGRVQSIKPTDTLTARIFNGIFVNNVDTGNFVTTYQPANNYYTVSPSSRNSNFTSFDLTDSFDFALVPKPNINDLEVQLMGLSTARPGFENYYRVITKNAGTTTISNAVIGFKHDSRQNYMDASRPPDGMAADSIWWGPFTLNAFAIDTLYIGLVNDAPPLLNNADTLSLRVTANPVVNDSSQSNNVASLREGVRGSFDPNDKTEVHAGTLTTTQYAGGEFLQYKIRFQNTGTDTAFFITVKDTLQNNMDLGTLEIVSASHPFTFRLNGNVATWDFKNIYLPDSTTNEAGSHGFILFKVKPKTGLAVGTVFTNNAAIYFDFNLPVITNPDQTVIGSNTGVCPNGNVTFAAGINGSSYQWQVNNGSGYTNVSNGGIYSGATADKLTLTGAPTSLSGYRYRCIVSGNAYSPEHVMRFAVVWTGAASTAWANAANWDCNALPDANTEVTIPARARYPVISANASCYSLGLSPGTSVTVNPGVSLSIPGKAN